MASRLIPAGTVVAICRVDDEDRRWKPHTLRRDLQFEDEYRSEACFGTGKAVIYREGEWLILTTRGK